jgi:hypothetical protein
MVLIDMLGFLHTQLHMTQSLISSIIKKHERLISMASEDRPSLVGLGLTLTPKQRWPSELCGQWQQWQLRRVVWWPYSFDGALQRHHCLVGVSPWRYSAWPCTHHVLRGHVQQQQCTQGSRSVHAHQPRATSACPVCARLVELLESIGAWQ